VQNVKIADLKNNLSRHLDRVKRGAELTVLDRDTPVARIIPFVHGQSGKNRPRAQQASAIRLAELTRSGVVEAAADGLAGWLNEHRPRQLPGRPRAVAVLLKARRESRR
jgi:antitoxin (DNA-binding transcriptional repressor) of toxin-antitoxin stability system